MYHSWRYASEMKFVKACADFLLTFLIIDGLWINLVALDLYQANIGALMTKAPRVGPAVLFYIGYAAAVIHLVVKPANTLTASLKNGAVLGAVAYGTFAVSNYALLAAWTFPMMLIDTLFGLVITAVASGIAHKVYH